jgi:hypothetical protein
MNKPLRILLTSDMHCTDLMDWYGVRDADRQQAWVDAVLAEHAKQPFDAIIIAGDISLDYHDKKTPYDKGHSTGLVFMQQFFSQLPSLPHFILPAIMRNSPMKTGWRWSATSARARSRWEWTPFCALTTSART